MDNIKPLKEQISITLDADIVEKMRNLAEYEGLQLSTYMNVVLRKYLRTQEEPK